MNKTKFALFVILSLTLTISTHTSHAYYASTPTSNKYSATITTSKTSYGAGEPIVLSGQVKPFEQGRKLSIIVRDSANNVVDIETAPVNSDATYSFSITDTAKWKKGSYKVAAQYGSSDVDIGTTTFSFDPSVKAKPPVAEVKSDVKEVKKKMEPKKKVTKETKKPKTKTNK